MAFTTPITPLPRLFPVGRTCLQKPQTQTRCPPLRPSHINMQGPRRTYEADTPKKQFLQRLKPLGKVRLIARNNAAIMESIATFDGLFYAKLPSGEYANIIDLAINLDMHLLLSGFSGCRFETGVSRSASKAPSYILRLLGNDRKEPVLSVFLQWDKDPSDIEPERIEVWKKLKQDYATDGSDSVFFEHP